MRTIATDLPGVVIIEPEVHADGRGFFLETYHADRYRAHGIAGPFVQDNHSRSVHRHAARPAPAAARGRKASWCG